MRRLVWRAAKVFGMLFTATVVLFVLANVVVAYRYPGDAHVLVSGHPVFNEGLRAVYERIYRLPIAVVREIIAECWRENAWIFEPYVQFREQPRHGRYVNISSDGFRLNSPTDRKVLDATPSTAVFLFGGSTMFGYGVRDEDTVAAHLEAMFRRDRARAGSRDVAVYNFGRGYYDSSQELLLLKSLLQRGLVPNVAVFMDGVNEKFCPAFSANIADVFKILQQDPAAKLRAVIASLPIVRLASPSYRSELTANAIYLNRALEGYAFECRCPTEPCLPQLLDTYMLNKRLIREMGRAFGFEVLFVVQPFGGYRNRFTTTPDGTKRPDVSLVLGDYERRAVQGSHDLSFTGILESYAGEPFVDRAHYTPDANRLIAERLYPAVVQALERPSPTRALAIHDRVDVEIRVASDTDTVFSFFTDAAKVKRWLGRAVSVRPVRDGQLDVDTGGGTWIRAKFLELDPGHRLALTWRWDSPNPAIPEGSSRVDVSFFPRPRGTLVQVFHAGVPAKAAGRYRDLWTHYLERLSIVVSGGDPGDDTWLAAGRLPTER